MCFSTDVEEQRRGPAIELALGGAARDWVRDIPIASKINGEMVDVGDGAGPQQLTGAAFILHTLAEPIMPLAEETSVRAMAYLHGFARLPSESTDQALMQRARQLLQIMRH